MMGQENSHELDPDTKPYTLSSRSLEAIAEHIKNGAKRIIVMTGAGISTSAGIPDFRSPETGLYSNLARLDLPYPEAVFDISYFRQKPEPFYVLAKELYPGQFYPTVSHAFIALLHEKGLLQMLFTQNIDCLERRAGVPGEKIVEAHGSFATQRCVDCKTEYPDNLMKKAVESGDVPHCIVPQCNGLVKPDIVFFGEQLPEAFFKNINAPDTADLILVMGTSLQVQPFASLPSRTPERIPRVLFNMERVGDLGSRPDDVIILGDCDTGVRKLADALGWREQLEAMWHEVGGKVKEKEAAGLREMPLAMLRDDVLEAEIVKIIAQVETSLKLSKDHTEQINAQLGSDSPKAEENSSLSAGLETVAGFKEPHSTPAVVPEHASPTSTPKATEEDEKFVPKDAVNTEKVVGEKPAETPAVNTTTILDATLPHNKPNSDVSSETKPASHI